MADQQQRTKDTENQWQGTGNKTDTSDLTLKAAAGAGVRNFLTDIVIVNTSATDTTVIVKDGSTEIARYPAPKNGGAIHSLVRPLKTTANTALNVAASAAVSTLYVTGTGFTGN